MKIFFTSLLLIVAASLQAATFTTIASGNWDNTGVWQNGNIGPMNGNNNVIIISPGNYVILDNDIQFGNGCEFDVDGSLVINGNLTAMNTLVINVSGSLVINGSIEVMNGGEITIIGNVSVSGDVVFENNGTINMNSGFLDIGGNLGGGSGCEINGTGVIDVGGTNTFDSTPSASVTVNSGLPVSMIGFSARCDDAGVVLEWTTASETNSAYFLIQRSSDMGLWEDIAQVSAAGNSNILQNYSYTDQLPLEGNSYYRLIQYDYDGKFEMFGPVSPDCFDNKTSAEFYPNPFVESLVISFPDEIPDNVSVVMTDAKGSVVLQYLSESNAVGNTGLTLDVSQVPAGVYFISVSADGFYLSSKIQKVP